MTDEIHPARLDLPPSGSGGPAMKYAGPSGRLTVTQSLSCQVPGMAPFQLSRGFSRWLRDVQQVYSRTMVVGEDWVQLDLGWLKGGVGHLVIENDKETFGRVPTREQVAASEARVVEVGYKILLGDSFGLAPPRDIAIVPLFVVPPGESMRATPVDVEMLWVRCRAGDTCVTVTMVPG